MNLKKVLQEIVNKSLEMKDEHGKKKLILTILENDFWYKEVDANTIYNILIDIGYSNEKSIEILKLLTSSENI